METGAEKFNSRPNASQQAARCIQEPQKTYLVTWQNDIKVQTKKPVVVRSGTHHSVGDLQHLLKKRVFLFVSSARVHDDDLEVFAFELLDSLGCDHHWIHLRVTDRKQTWSQEGAGPEIQQTPWRTGRGTTHLP